MILLENFDRDFQQEFSENKSWGNFMLELEQHDFVRKFCERYSATIWENKIGEISNINLNKTFVSDIQQKISGNKIWGFYKHDFVREVCERFSPMIFTNWRMVKHDIAQQFCELFSAKTFRQQSLKNFQE